jgi:hypothetical protein
VGWSIGCCDVELSRGSCPSNSANDVRQTRREAAGGSGLQFVRRSSPRLCGMSKMLSTAAAGSMTGIYGENQQAHGTLEADRNGGLFRRAGDQEVQTI